MNRAERSKYETPTKVLKALAQAARLKLVDVLSEHSEVCVCDLTEEVAMDMLPASRHLAQFKHAGIVDSDKRGQMVFYSLRVEFLKSLFGCIESVVKCNLDQQLKILS